MSIRVQIAFVLLLCLPLLARAERKYVLGTQVDFMAGGTNQIGNGSLAFNQLQNNLSLFYGVSPSLDLRSIGHRSEIDLSYGVYGDRFQSSPKLTSVSHRASANLLVHPGERTRFKLSLSYSSLPDFGAYSVLKGIVLVPEGFQFLYEPLLSRRTSQSMQGAVGLETDLTSKSFLTFDLSSNYRQYDHAYENAEFFRGRLGDQFNGQGSIGISHKASRHQTWSLKFIASENRYREYGNARTETAALGVTQQLSPHVHLSLEAGPSYIISELKQYQAYIGYLANASISADIRSNHLALYYSHTSGSSMGLGSVSETHNAGLSFSRSLTRRLGVTSSVSAYDSIPKFDNPYKLRGLNGALDLSFSVSRLWFLAFGGSYRLNEGAYLRDVEYKRAYVSVRFRAPELWRFSR